MGARQSKRSVDITTEPSKDIIEGAGELKKLDDTFVKENESSDKENKVANDAAENEKNESVKVDEVVVVALEEKPAVPETETEAPSAEDKPTEEINEATPESDSAVKPKKEKVKKKWSFRSISFGKKDKQKPSKKDKKNEENKAVAEGTDEKMAEDGAETKPAETAEDATTADVTKVETKPLEPVVEAVITETVKAVEKVKTAPAPEPVIAVVEAVKEKMPEPVVIVVVAPPQPEEKVEEVKEIEVTPPAEIEEVAVALPTVEAPPAIPASPPPSQFSVFAESMNTAAIVEESLPEPIKQESEIESEITPVASEMVEKVLEQAVDHIESEIAEKDDDEEEDEELPPPPADDYEIPPVAEVVVEVTQNGVGEHIEEPIETVKLENGVHNGDDINESEPIVEELKKEDKVADKIAQDLPLAPEIIAE